MSSGKKTVSNKRAKSAAKKAPAKKRAAKKVPPKKGLAGKKSAGKRKPNIAFKKAMQPGGVLSSVIGGNAPPRPEVTEKIWAYIKKHGAKDDHTERKVLPATIEPRHLTHAQIEFMVKSVRKP
jgi:chromatin remodeling complex protein RSC6